MLALSIFIAALVLDRVWGEPKRLHPLVLWSYLPQFLERHLNKQQKWQGVLALLLAVLLPLSVLLAAFSLLRENPIAHTLLSALCLYCVIGWQSLRQHGLAVADALAIDLTQGQAAVARMVSRDTAQMQEADVVKAGLESLLENGADAIFSAIFWFFLLGPIGAVAYRLINTLDAMWGYQTPRYQNFGYCAAKLDDAMNYIPARLTALSYALLGNTRLAIHSWRLQAKLCVSPNGGPVMCAGAGSLNVQLGGGAVYHGQWRDKPIMGGGDLPNRQHIAKAIKLIDQTVYLWLAVITLVAVLAQGVSFA